IRPSVDVPRHASSDRTAEQRRRVGKLVLEVASNIPCLVHDMIAIAQDGRQMLAAQGANGFDIGKPHRSHLKIEPFVGEGVPDAPREWAGAAAFMANALVEDQRPIDRHAHEPLAAEPSADGIAAAATPSIVAWTGEAAPWRRERTL